MKKTGKKVIRLNTKSLYLEPKKAEEMKAAWEKETDPELKKAYEERLQGMETHPEEWIFYTEWKICLKREGTVIGEAGFKGTPDEKAEVWIDYAIKENFQGQGYGMEAVKALTDWAFSNENIYFVLAEVLPDNKKSQRLLEKLGFKLMEKNGEEGLELRFEKERPASAFMSIYMSFGMSLGLCFGLSLFDNIATGMLLGMAIGMAVGSSMDSEDKKKREALYQLRGREENK